MSVATLLALTNTTRVLEDLRTLASFGVHQSAGQGLHVSRPSFSDVDMATRRWVASRMEAAGLLGVQIDGLGSVYGSAGVDNAPALLMGGYTDTSAAGTSWLDGTLGLAYALEAARVLHEGGAADWTAWSVINWQLDEEGNFGHPLAAPTAFVAEDAKFIPSKELWRARTAAAVAGTPIMHASGRQGGWAGYLEGYVERGSALLRANASLGVVHAIAGSRQLRLVCPAPSGPAAEPRAASSASSAAEPSAAPFTAPLQAMRMAAALDDGLSALCAAWDAEGCSGSWHFFDFEGFPSRDETRGEGSGGGGGGSGGGGSGRFAGAHMYARHGAHMHAGGGANITLELRATDEQLLDRMSRLAAAISDGSATAPLHTALSSRACTLLPLARAAFPVSTLDLGLVECIREATMATVGEVRTHRIHSRALLSAVVGVSPMAQVMPAALLLIARPIGEQHGRQEEERPPRREKERPPRRDEERPWDDEHTARLIADGARAFVRAAVGVAFGACQSERGPTCIVGDKRRNVRLANPSWSAHLAGEEAEAEQEDEREEGRSEEVASVDSELLNVADYPDL